MSRNKCVECRSFQPIEFDGKQAGECRAKPPTVVRENAPDGSKRRVSRFPMVAEDMWCGQFVQRSQDGSLGQKNFEPKR